LREHGTLKLRRGVLPQPVRHPAMTLYREPGIGFNQDLGDIDDRGRSKRPILRPGNHPLATRHFIEVNNPLIPGFWASLAPMSEELCPSMTRAWSPERKRRKPFRLAIPINSGRKPLPWPVPMPCRAVPRHRP
jgi:hypothetical protein